MEFKLLPPEQVDAQEKNQKLREVPMSENETEERTDTNNRSDNSVKYPSAELVQSICYSEYQHCLATYDKIYEKVNIALAFSGIILVLVLSSFDYTVISRLSSATKLELFTLITYLSCSVVASICLLWAVLKLLLLMRSRQLTVFDSIDLQNEKIYNENKDVASLWIIDKLTRAILEIKNETKKKQRSYDFSVILVVIALIAYAVVLIIQKGL